MNKSSLPFWRVNGIPIQVDFSWFLIFALITWSLATSYFPTDYKNWSTPLYWAIGALTAGLFFVSVFLHELAHSLVAQRFHIPVRKITLYIFGGISEMKVEPPTATSELWITLSGPLMNLLLAGLFALLSLAFPSIAPVQALTRYLAYANLLLGAFNLIPGYPLDGGSVLMAIIWGITHKRQWGIITAAYAGNIIAYLLIFFGAVQLFGGNIMNGLWIAFIGWFMLNASTGAVRQERLKGLLLGHKVSEAMSKQYIFVYPDTTLQYLVENHILGSPQRSFLVKKDERVVGMLTIHAVQAIPKNEWPSKTVEQVMIPAAQMITVSPDTELYDAIQAMDRDGVNQLPVMANGDIQGILTREDVISYLRRLQTSGPRNQPAF